MSLFQNNSDQKFIWPETKNPIILIVKRFGGYSIILLMGAIYLSNQLGVKSQWPVLIVFNLFLFSMAWLCLQQRLKVYKLAGWVIIFCGIWFILMDLFPNIFTITPWWY